VFSSAEAMMFELWLTANAPTSNIVESDPRTFLFLIDENFIVFSNILSFLNALSKR
jgi:hypothetical protein